MSTKELPPFTMKESGKNVEIKLRRVLLSFCDVFEATEGEDDDGKKTCKFSVSTGILLDKETERGKAQIGAVRDAMKIARTAEWGETPPTITADRLCLQDGEPIDPNTADPDVPGSGERKARWDGYAGRMYITAKRHLGDKIKTKDAAEQLLRENHPVQILGPRKTAVINGVASFPVLKESDGLIYSGCIADVIVQIFPYNGTGKGPNNKNLPHRILCSLEAIKFVEHGTPFGQKRINAQDAFDEEEGEEDETPSTSNGGACIDENDPLG